MTAQATPLDNDPFRLAGANLTRVTLKQLRDWETEFHQIVVAPKTDEEAWEGTELDMARTTL